MTDWIKNLKVGDQVILCASRFRTQCERLTKVSRITKTGRIKIDNLTFLPDGTQWGGGSCYNSTYYSLIEATPENIARLEAIKNRKKILFNMIEVVNGKRKLSDDQIFRIGEIIDEGQGVEAV